MRDPTTDLVVEKLIGMTVEFLSDRYHAETLVIGDQIVREGEYCKRHWQELSDALDADVAILARGGRLVRKRGRPPQRHQAPIAGAVAMLVEDVGLPPTRSHREQRQRGPSACSIVTAALERLGKRLSERRVEGIWDERRLSSLRIHRILKAAKCP